MYSEETLESFELCYKFWYISLIITVSQVIGTDVSEKFDFLFSWIEKIFISKTELPK